MIWIWTVFIYRIVLVDIRYFEDKIQDHPTYQSCQEEKILDFHFPFVEGLNRLKRIFFHELPDKMAKDIETKNEKWVNIKINSTKLKESYLILGSEHPKLVKNSKNGSKIKKTTNKTRTVKLKYLAKWRTLNMISIVFLYYSFRDSLCLVFWRI